MKTKLLRRLRRRADREIGMVATLRFIPKKHIAYYVGDRNDILLKRYHRMSKYESLAGATKWLNDLRRNHIEQWAFDMYIDKGNSKLRKLNRKRRRL